METYHGLNLDFRIKSISAVSFYKRLHKRELSHRAGAVLVVWSGSGTRSDQVPVIDWTDPCRAVRGWWRLINERSASVPMINCPILRSDFWSLKSVSRDGFWLIWDARMTLRVDPSGFRTTWPFRAAVQRPTTTQSHGGDSLWNQPSLQIPVNSINKFTMNHETWLSSLDPRISPCFIW